MARTRSVGAAFDGVAKQAVAGGTTGVGGGEGGHASEAGWARMEIWFGEIAQAHGQGRLAVVLGGEASHGREGRAGAFLFAHLRTTDVSCLCVLSLYRPIDHRKESNDSQQDGRCSQSFKNEIRSTHTKVGWAPS